MLKLFLFFDGKILDTFNNVHDLPKLAVKHRIPQDRAHEISWFAGRTVNDMQIKQIKFALGQAAQAQSVEAQATETEAPVVEKAPEVKPKRRGRRPKTQIVD